MTRRRAPRPASRAIGRVLEGLRPPGLLAEVQGVWRDAVGPAIAERSRPVSEREGTVTVAAESSVWSQELELMEGDLRASVEGRIGSGRIARLKFVVEPSLREGGG